MLYGVVLRIQTTPEGEGHGKTMAVDDDDGDFEIKFWIYWRVSVETSYHGVSFSIADI